MSKMILHVAIGFFLSGCTINQYGPSITVGDKELTLAQVSNASNEPETLAMQPGAQPVHSTKPVIAQATPSSKTKSCVPMPVIPEPPKIDMEELKKYKDNPQQLEKILRDNHNQLYVGWLKMKKELEQWRRRSDRC